MSGAESSVVAYVLNSLWQVPLIVMAAWLAARMMRAIGPAAEHRVWVGALIGEALLPAASLLPWERLNLAWPWHLHAGDATKGERDGADGVGCGVGGLSASCCSDCRGDGCICDGDAVLRCTVYVALVAPKKTGARGGEGDAERSGGDFVAAMAKTVWSGEGCTAFIEANFCAVDDGHCAKMRDAAGGDDRETSACRTGDGHRARTGACAADGFCEEPWV
jgi:hypothetical protein